MKRKDFLSFSHSHQVKTETPRYTTLEIFNLLYLEYRWIFPIMIIIPWLIVGLVIFSSQAGLAQSFSKDPANFPPNVFSDVFEDPDIEQKIIGKYIINF